MTRHRIEKVEEIFLEAASLRPDDRARFMDERCAGDQTLRAEVEALLAHDAGQEDLVLSAPLVAPGLLPRNLVETDDQGGLKPGTRIGSYTIVALLGSGGMGAVYLARQETPRRTVALKVLRADAASTAILRRMELEAEMLGRLKHPGIAQIFEAGRADYGLGPQPFFAMELIEGPTLTQYAADHNLSTRGRLELMRKVCEAVEHAHRKGVIHRDLKPGNILVDPSGQPKVVDFGVARALDADLNVTTMRTGVGAVIGTLSYMSPEQASADPTQVDTRADVYALGVVLYQLLSGRLPHDLTGRNLPDSVRVISEQTPRPLGPVDRSLRGDVETIVARAMEKDRERRYQSAAALAEDLRRCLAGEAIEAKRDSAIYVLRKHLRRYRSGVAAVCLIVIALSAFSLYSAKQADRNLKLAHDADDARARADALRAAAESQAERLRRANYFSNIGFAQAAYASQDVQRMRRVLDECPPDLRGWEWRYLMGISDASSATIRWRNRGWGSAHLSASGDTLTAWWAEDVYFWNARTRAKTGQIRSETWVRGAGLMPDGRVAMYVDPESVQIRDVATGRILSSTDITVKNGRTAVLSPDGAHLACVGRGIAVVDLTVPSVRWCVQDAGPGVMNAAWSADGRILATADIVGTIRLRDAATGDLLSISSGHFGIVRDLAFSPDGKRLASAGNDTTIRLWDIADPRAPKAGPVHRVFANKVAGIAFSRDGHYITAGGSEAVIRIIDSNTGAVAHTLCGHENTVFWIAYTPDGEELITTGLDGLVKWWPSSGPAANPTRALGDSIISACLSRDGGRLITAGTAPGLRILDCNTLKVADTRNGPVRFGRDLATSGKTAAMVTLDDHVYLWDLSPGGSVRALRGHTQPATGVTWCPVRDCYISCAEDGTIRAWTDTKGEPVHTIEAGGKLTAIACSPDGARVYAGTDDGSVRAWDTATWAQIASWSAHTASIWALLVSADGATLYTAADDEVTHAWDAATGRRLHTFQGHKGAVQRLALSPDASRLATCGNDNTVRIWDTATATEILTLRGHNNSGHGIAFTQGGRRLISCDFDGKVFAWDAPEPRLEARATPDSR